MSKSTSPHLAKGIRLQVFRNHIDLGTAAAAQAAKLLVDLIGKRGRVRILVATGNSQRETIAALVQHKEVDWSKVECFHLDEYVGISGDHPASFRYWIRTRFAEKVTLGAMHYIQGDTPKLDDHVREYSARLFSAPVDLAFVGFGENGHIAFNDPHVADFADPLLVKRVDLDEACRRQQVGEGHFPSIADVPNEAITVSCSGLFRVEHWISCVPESRKAPAVKAALEGPVTTDCPASLVQRHPHVLVNLDLASAALLSPATRAADASARSDG